KGEAMATYRAGHRAPLNEQQPPGTDRLDTPVSGPVVPGPEPVRYLVDGYYLADRSPVASVGRVRQKVRHRAAFIVRVTLETVAVRVLPLAVTGALHRFPPEPGAAAQFRALDGLLHRPVLVGVMWIPAGVKAMIALLQSLMYRIAFHERGFEIATGVLHRRKQFIWYYQLTEEPLYVRTPVI